MQVREKKNLLYLFLSGIITLFPSLWVGRVGIMEARNFVTAREMVQNGNWIITTMNGEFRFEKPPFPTWLTALFMKFFNTTTNEFVLRLPIAICTLGLIFLIYFLVKSATENPELAFISGLVSTTTFMIIKLGNEDAWDMFPYIFMFGCVTYIFIGLKSLNTMDFIISGIFMGASLLSKGPVPVYGMMLPFFVAYSVTYGFSNIRVSWKKILFTIIIGVSLAALWPAAIMLTQKDLFISVMNKEASTWLNKHVKSIFYYFDYIIYIGVWMIFALASFFKKWSEKRSPDNKFFSMLFLWNLITFVLISLIKMKKKRYGVPLYILTPMMASHLIFYFINREWKKLVKIENFIIKTHTILMVTISILIPPMFYFKGYRSGHIGIVYLSFIAMFFLFFSYEFVMGFIKKRKIEQILFMTGFLMITINISVTWFVEKYVRTEYRDEYKYLSTLKSSGPQEYPIYTFDDDEITNVWNVGKKIELIGDLQELPNIFFVLDDREEPLINEKFRTEFIIKSKNTYYKYEDEDKTIHLYKVVKNTKD
ncbi:glycosyltransferase family 39 protein [uncultured Ilyobacter sp.]|uniref:ArnT family glycosyltransferase n=1 Tax=uncultured Ilyobacter sp. TaxID=544433 RepID=UPI0029C6EEED|nr:glycosyltransferase family 39 protein [uncultured Ilyobacter sp.]